MNKIGKYSHPSNQALTYLSYLILETPSRVPNMIPCIVIASADESNNDEYVAQVNTHPGQAGSFVTITIRAGHPLHPFMREKIGMLNLAGEGEAIEGLGENHSKAHYNVYITPEQHNIICANGEHTDLRTNQTKE